MLLLPMDLKKEQSAETQEQLVRRVESLQVR